MQMKIIAIEGLVFIDERVLRAACDAAPFAAVFAASFIMFFTSSSMLVLDVCPELLWPLR